MPTFGELYVPLTRAHFTEGIEVHPPVGSTGPQVHRTHCWVDVPPVSGALPHFAKPNPLAEHWSDTRAETIPTINGLVGGLLFPAFFKLDSIIAAIATGCYDPGSVVFTKIGVLGDKAFGTAVMRSTVPGILDVYASVVVDAPPEAVAVVEAMVDGYVIPAIRTETGLR